MPSMGSLPIFAYGPLHKLVILHPTSVTIKKRHFDAAVQWWAQSAVFCTTVRAVAWCE